MVSAHGLAASIRASQESETYDLGGQTVSTITSTMESAFAEPFELQEMIRLTFITGAGKQARQKYDDNAAKAVTSTLQKYGYNEDRGASCVMECGGSYKLQHDTGKNLKTVVVFPKIHKEKQEEEPSFEPLIPEDSPGYKICISSMAVFQNIVKAKCPSWSQKKGCMESIKALKDIMASLDEDLVKGVPLNDAEQAFYNAVVNLDEKETYLKQQAQSQVEKGNVTKFELDLLLQQNAERVAALKKQGKYTTKAEERKELLESIEPVEPHKLKYQAEISQLYKELVPLLQLEEETKGRLLTIKETQSMTRKDEIMEEVEYLEEASRGWFEDDDAFESRVQASRDAFQVKRARKARKTGGGTTIGADTKVRVPVDKWVTPGETQGGFSSIAAKRRAKMKKGSVFGAMMMDSDSSSEEEEEEPSSEVVDKACESAAKDGKSGSKKKKRKRKKAKSRQTARSTEEELETEGEEKEEPETALAQTGAFLNNYILPFVVAFLGWIIGLVFGKTKKRGGGQRR